MNKFENFDLYSDLKEGLEESIKIKNIEERINYTLSTFAVEGLVPYQRAIDYAVKVEQGNMSLEEAVDAIKRMYGVGDKK